MSLSDIDDSQINRGVQIKFSQDGYAGFLHVGHRKVRVAKNGYLHVGSRKIRQELIRYIVDYRYADKKPENAEQLRDSFGIIMKGLVRNSGKSSTEIADGLSISARYIRSMTNGKRFPKKSVIKEVLGLWSIDFWKFWEKVSEVYEEKYLDE